MEIIEGIIRRLLSSSRTNSCCRTPSACVAISRWHGMASSPCSRMLHVHLPASRCAASEKQRVKKHLGIRVRDVAAAACASAPRSSCGDGRGARLCQGRRLRRPRHGTLLGRHGGKTSALQDGCRCKYFTHHMSAEQARGRTTVPPRTWL